MAQIFCPICSHVEEWDGINDQSIPCAKHATHFTDLVPRPGTPPELKEGAVLAKAMDVCAVPIPSPRPTCRGCGRPVSNGVCIECGWSCD